MFHLIHFCFIAKKEKDEQAVFKHEEQRRKEEDKLVDLALKWNYFDGILPILQARQGEMVKKKNELILKVKALRIYTLQHLIFCKYLTEKNIRILIFINLIQSKRRTLLVMLNMLRNTTVMCLVYFSIGITVKSSQLRLALITLVALFTTNFLKKKIKILTFVCSAIFAD